MHLLPTLPRIDSGPVRDEPIEAKREYADATKSSNNQNTKVLALINGVATRQVLIELGVFLVKMTQGQS